jgi:hypothetical protein
MREVPCRVSSLRWREREGEILTFQQHFLTSLRNVCKFSLSPPLTTAIGHLARRYQATKEPSTEPVKYIHGNLQRIHDNANIRDTIWRKIINSDNVPKPHHTHSSFTSLQ